MTLFVTGGTGFIGRHFLHAALAGGHRMVAQRRSRPESPPGAAAGVTWLDRPLDAITAEDLAGCDACVHLASPGVSPKVAAWEELLYWNVDALIRLMGAGRDAGVRRFVVAGTFAEYGRAADAYDTIPPEAPLQPTYAYAASKAAGCVAATGYAIEQRLELAYLRIFSAYGEGQHEGNFWPSLRAAALAGRDFDMTPGEQIRDFMPVEDVAQSFLAALAHPAATPGRPWVANVGTGRPVTMRAFAEAWWKRWGARGRLNVGALPYRANEVMRYVPKI